MGGKLQTLNNENIGWYTVHPTFVLLGDVGTKNLQECSVVKVQILKRDAGWQTPSLERKCWWANRKPQEEDRFIFVGDAGWQNQKP